MKTKFEQITKKISLGKVIDMDYILWENSIDDNTLNRLKNCGYSVEQEHFGRYYLISW
jgi:hypothetical protein